MKSLRILAVALAVACAGVSNTASAGDAEGAHGMVVVAWPASKAEVEKNKVAAHETRPFYKSWWFWGAIGGAVALGGTALIVASTGGSSQMEMQIHIPR